MRVKIIIPILVSPLFLLMVSCTSLLTGEPEYHYGDRLVTAKAFYIDPTGWARKTEERKDLQYSEASIGSVIKITKNRTTGSWTNGYFTETYGTVTVANSKIKNVRLNSVLEDNQGRSYKDPYIVRKTQ